VSKKILQKRTTQKPNATKKAGKRRSPNMEDFHCNMLELNISFSADEFDKDALLKEFDVEDESEYIDEDGDLVLGVSFGSREEALKQHAHLRIVIFKDKKGLATLGYHKSGMKIDDKKPPYVEDCAQWLGGFFKDDEIVARINAGYEFNKEFAPTIALPFPLVASNKALAGLKVTGLSLRFPEDAPIETAVLQHGMEKTYLYLLGKSAIKLKEFELDKELEALTVSVDSLVKRQENPNGGNKETT
jgi:hypothetical protein